MTGSAPRSPAIGASPLLTGARASSCWVFCRGPLMSCQSYLPLPIARAFIRRFRRSLSVAPPFGLECLTSLADSTAYYAVCDSCATVGSPLNFPSSNTGPMAQSSPGKFDRLHRTPAGSTALALMDLDFATSGPLVRPRMPHIRFLFVRLRLCSALPSDAFARPCAFASPSPPSGWTRDFHPQAIEHAGHTTKSLPR
jgi:hypothetical protein